MAKKTGLFLLLVWLFLLWILFLRFQQSPFTQEYHIGTYLITLLKVAAILLVTTSTGARLLALLRCKRVSLPVASAIGLALLGIVSLGLGSAGGIRPYVIWPIIAALAAVSIRQLATVLRRLGSLPVLKLEPVEVLVTSLLAFVLVVCLVNCLAPVTANDALVYHLALPKSYASEGHTLKLAYNVYANMPHYGEILYTVFYSVAGEPGARLLYFFMLVAASGAVYALARRFAERRFALIAAGIFLAQPLLLDNRIVCNIDVMLTYFFICAVISAFDTLKEPAGWKPIVALALLAGFMLGMKYTAIAACLSLLPVLLGAPGKHPSWRVILIGVAVTAIIFIPWAIKNETSVGNPFYPMLEETFDGDNWDSVQGSQLVAWQRSMGMGRSALDYLLLPWNISTKAKPGMNYSRFDGTITPVILILLPLALIRWRRRTNILIIMAAIGFTFWALSSQQLRFLIPTLALLAVVGSIGVANIAEGVSERWVSIVLIVIVLIQVSGLLVPDQYGNPFISRAFGDRLAVVTGTETSEDYLGRTIQPFTMFEHINRNLPPGEPVFMIWENRGYYLNRPYFADSFFEASTLMRMVTGAGNPAQLKQTIEQMGYRYVVVNDLLGEVFAGGYSRRDIGILRAFISEHLEPIHTSNRMTLYAMKSR